MQFEPFSDERGLVVGQIPIALIMHVQDDEVVPPHQGLVAERPPRHAQPVLSLNHGLFADAIEVREIVLRNDRCNARVALQLPEEALDAVVAQLPADNAAASDRVAKSRENFRYLVLGELVHECC